MMTSCGSLDIRPEPLNKTNPYLVDKGFRDLQIKRSTETSFAIEGIHVDLDKVGFRCAPCNKLLAKPNAEGNIAGQVKCPRCGELNER